MGAVWQCGRFQLQLKRPLVMGILNVTPDSFSDGSLHFETAAAVEHGLRLIEEGADILDIGAESTRPGAVQVPEVQEVRRLLPVLEGLLDAGIPISIDTFKPGVMREVLAAGADIINDIYAFRQPGAIEAVAAYNCGLCVMHMQGEPRTMQEAPYYKDVVAEVRGFLQERVACLKTHGIDAARIALDPGLGFGKTVEHNYMLLRQFPRLRFDHFPWLVALSRKSMIGHVTGREPAARLGGSIAGALAGIVGGGSVIRVHDVAATVDAIKVWQAVFQED